ncbi:MAG: carboxymuconolactone decarboxylase family protein [Tissierellia bacterium]|nr:carboxymuconolactone decarboxylase family protein [Tissierellia bacterium]
MKLLNNYMKAAPELGKGFNEFHHAAMAPGSLDLKTKELIAVGIAVSVKCVFCFQSHIASALEAGAQREEIVEAINVGILMAGGPGLAYGIQALECLDQLLEERK